MLRKLLILLLILGIFVVPFLAINIEGMTSTETTNNPPPPPPSNTQPSPDTQPPPNNPTQPPPDTQPPPNNPTQPSNNPTQPSNNPTQPYNPSYPNYPTHNTNTNTTYTNYPYPTRNNQPSNQQNDVQYPNYYDSFPKGVPKNQILPGQEDLYILKSQVVPPVCPACNPVVIYKNKPCEACPACARCPEPSFECKKVPNYNAVNNEFLPKPILNSFSSFGM
jgi:hypothetical protein